MIRIIGLLIALFICAQYTYAQKAVFFAGEVRDSTGAPLQFANVMAVDTVTKKMAGFAVTNTDGQFRISLESGRVYSLKLTFIGYAPMESLITPTESNELHQLFVMNNDGLELDELQIVAEMPVTIRGDTITYAADAFTQGDERKLEDVLEDLPGFQVEENGEIMVQGKKVDKVLIDGKEFFEGDSKLATKNLPANVVDKIQLLQNYNDIGPLSGLGPTDQLALNVELKEDKKEIVFGDLTAAGGPQNRYLGHANAFYYSKKTNLNLIADANNIGELAFTMSDYFRFAGGLGSLTERRGSRFNMSNDQLGIPMAERNSARSLNNELGAFNFSLTPSRNWKFSGFLIGSAVDNGFGSLSTRTYLQENNTLGETFLSGNSVKSQSGLGKFSADYAPNYNLHLSYQAFGRTANIENGSSQLSEVNAGVNEISGMQTQQPWAFEQQLRAFYSMSEKDILSMEIGQNMQHQDPSYDLKTTIQPFQGTIPMTTDDPFNLVQQRRVETDKLEMLGNYYRIINRTNHVNLSFGRTINDQTYSAQLFQNVAGGNQELDPATFGNNATFGFRDSFAGLLFRSKWKKLTWSPEINLHYYQVAHDQTTGSEKFDRLMWLPGFSAKWDIRSSQSLNFRYSLNASFMDIQKVMNNLVVTSYNFLETGNPNLRNSAFHSFSLDYRNFNMYSFFNFYGGLNYQIKEDDIQNNYAVSSWERIGIPVNVLPVNRELSGYLNLEKRFDEFRVGLDGNWTFSSVNNQLNQSSNTNLNFRQVYKGLISSRIWDKVSLRLTHELTINKYEGNQGANTFLNNETGFRTNWTMGKGFSWLTTYSITNYKSQSSTTNSQYDMLDSVLRYRKKGSPWEFSVEGLNILNTRSIRRDSFSDNLISTYSYDIQQRYYILRVMFDI